LGKEAYLLIR